MPMDALENSSVQELLILLKQRHIEALDVLYPMYGLAFYRYARHHHLTHEDAEDVVQTIFCRLLDRIESYDEGREGGERWLWRICHNQVIDCLRRQKSSQLPNAEMLVGEFDPDAYLIDQEQVNAFARGWAALDESDRTELKRGRGRGLGRKAWHAAVVKLRDLCRFEE
jgi:RNA polymerase sigma factor (sigma-70 family)